MGNSLLQQIFLNKGKEKKQFREKYRGEYGKGKAVTIIWSHASREGNKNGIWVRCVSNGSEKKRIVREPLYRVREVNLLRSRDVPWNSRVMGP